MCLDIDRAIATETCRWKYLHISDVFRLTFLFLAVPVQKEKKKKKKTGHNNDAADDNDDITEAPHAQAGLPMISGRKSREVFHLA